jgi:PadR family transcriptional regulator PadR
MSRYATPPRKDRVAGPAAADFLHGTLDTLILKTLAGGPMHGYAIGKWIEDATGAAIELEEGTLYPALYRLEKRGLLDAEWGTSELGRRAKFYRLTRTGRQHLLSHTAAWAEFAAAVNRILLPAFARERP